MSEAKLLNIGDVERYESKLHECAHNGRPFTASWGEIKSFLITIRSLMEWQGDVQEREAAVCPEDLGFDEYIRVLERKLAAAPASTVAPVEQSRTPLGEIEVALISIADGVSPQEAVGKAFNIINRERSRHCFSAPAKSIERIRFVLTQILNDLPAKRDWLDPTLEQEARVLTAPTTEEGAG